jgi:serine/threonine protein kinase/DnaJ-domain-containing protein 1
VEVEEEDTVNGPEPMGAQETAEIVWGGAPPPASSAAGPTRIGKYEVVALLGRGGMGAVYRGFDPVLEREVALKVMLPQIADDPEQKLRFEREARAVARLAHPSVVTVYDLGYHTDGSPYIVMELLTGHDLATLLKSGTSIGVERSTWIVLQVLEGLGLAHQRGIVHRDIKPPNIFITDGEAVKIMDFGIARFTSTLATSSGMVMGTAAYMSPEQVRGEPVDGRSDLFSTGIVLCELLTGRRPFQSESAMATMYRIANDEPVIEAAGQPQIEALLPVLRRALAKRVDERYPSAAEFAAHLQLSLERLGPAAGDARRAGSADTVAMPAPHPPAAPPPGVATTSPEKARANASGIFALLREIYTGSKSGHLHFSVGQGRKSLRILQGRIIHGASDVDGEHLGDMLVRYGLLDQTSLERAVAVVLKERRRLGAVLPELGILERDKVEQAVGLHVREILFSALDSPAVSFSFEEVTASELESDLVCPLSTGEVILEATRRIQDPELVKGILGDMGRKLELSPDPLLRSQSINLTPTDGFVLSRIDGTLSAREVVDLIPLPAEDTERSLFSLLCTGVVGYAPETTGRRSANRTTPAPEPRSPEPPVAAPPPPSPEARTPLPPKTPPPPPPSSSAAPRAATRDERKKASTKEIRRLILELHAKLHRDHFDVLGIDRSASETEIREAYAGFAKVLHPDACRDPALADLRERRIAVFARLSEAYDTLRDPESRARYQLTCRPPKAPVSAPSPALTAPPSEPTTPPPAAAPASDSSGSGATPSLDLRQHPERVIRFAEALFRDAKYWEAIGQLEGAIPRLGEPLRSEARVLLARAYLKNPNWTRRAALVLQRAVDANPRHIEAYLLLGKIYADARLRARARAMYRKALELDPTNSRARYGLKAVESASG